MSDHQRKRWDQSEERKVVERSAGEGNGIENENAGRTQGLRGDDVFLALQRHAANDQRDAGKKSDRNSQFRRNQIVFERIFHEEGDAEEQGKPANPGEHFRAHELLPVDVRAGGAAVSICTSSTGMIGFVSGIGGGTTVTGKGGGTETDGMIGAAGFGCVDYFRRCCWRILARSMQARLEHAAVAV